MRLKSGGATYTTQVTQRGLHNAGQEDGMNERVSFFEMQVDDADRAIRFYENVFGWKITKQEQSPIPYWLIATGATEDGEGVDGGMMQRQNPGNGYLCTVRVDDLDSSLAQVQGRGGSLIIRMPIPSVGWLAYVQDPEGNVFAMMQPDENAA